MIAGNIERIRRLAVRSMTVHRIVITPSRNIDGNPRHSNRGALYDVTYQGEVIVIGSLQPCLDSARILKAKGLTGRLEMWDTVLPYCRFHTEIDRAAGLTIEEGDSLPRLRKYRVHPGGDAQDGDFGSGGIPVAQTGEGRSGESPAALGQIPAGQQG